MRVDDILSNPSERGLELIVDGGVAYLCSLHGVVADAEHYRAFVEAARHGNRATMQFL